MRPWLRGMLQFVGVALALDWMIGAGLSSLYRRTTTGEGGGLVNHMMTKDAEILVLGSSRAKEHVVPSVLREELSLTTYNGGANGQGFLFAMMLLDLWKARHAPPRAIILHVDADTFRGTNEELQKTSVLSYYVDASERVREVLFSRSEFERLKYVSRAYRFNGKVLPIAKNLFIRGNPDFDGYEGLTGKLDVAALGSPKRIARGPLFSDRSLRYFEELVAYCQEGGTRLILVHSPQFVPDPELYRDWVSALTSAIARYPIVTFVAIDETTHPEAFADRPDLFADEWHLNDEGARVFSRLLAASLRGPLSRP